MIGEWQPTNSSGKSETIPTPELIRTLADNSTSPNRVTPDIRLAAQECIKCSPDLWTDSFKNIEDDALIGLAFFYIRAESTIAGFEAGAANPAILVFRYLKSEGRKPSKDIIKAMKAETDNRFIPHGDALS